MPNKTIWYLLFILTLLSLNNKMALAGTLGSTEAMAQYQPLVTLTIGPDFVQKGQAKTISLLPPFQNDYTNIHTSTTVADAGAFIGVERVMHERLGVQLGISGYVDGQLSPQGNVQLFTSPTFNVLHYNYNVHHTRVMAEAKFLTILPSYPAFHPYVSGGLGAAFNRAENYQEAVLVPEAVPMQPFVNNPQTSFTWSIGLGVDYTLNTHIRLGTGYQFADLGSVSLGPTPAAATTQTISIPHLYTNQLRFQFTLLV